MESVAHQEDINTIAIKLYAELCRENIRRNREMFEGYNPINGRGCPERGRRSSLTTFLFVVRC